MLRYYLIPLLTLSVSLSLATGACKPRDAADDRGSGAVSDSAARAGAKAEGTSGMARKTGELSEGLQQPEAVRWDADQNVWFVANINGDPTGKDNNGYISRLSAEGKMETAKFIAGGTKGVILHAPKGMAISADTLWVADIDVARAFNRKTGAPIASVPMKGAKFLNDAAIGPDGKLYLTDTGMGAKGHPGPDRIYQVAGRGATIALESPKLNGPNGITWDRDHFVIVPFLGKDIVSWKPGDKDVQVIGSGPGQQDGVEVLSDGRILTDSWADSSLIVLDSGKATKVASGVASPADLGYDGKSKIMVPLLLENRVEIWELP